MSFSKRFRNLAAAFLMALSTVAPMGGALVRSAYAEGSDNIKPISDDTIVHENIRLYSIFQAYYVVNLNWKVIIYLFIILIILS